MTKEVDIYSEHEKIKSIPIWFDPNTTLGLDRGIHKLTNFEKLSLTAPQRAKRNPEIPEKIGQEFQVNTYTMYDQRWLSLASFNDSRFVVTWTSLGQDGDNYGIYGQLFNADVSKNGLEFQVNTYTTSSQQTPSVASFSDGRFVVAWTSLNQDGDGWGIYGQLFAIDSVKNGSEFQVNTYTTSNQASPSVASLSEDQFIVTWASYQQDGSDNGIYGQLFNSNGSKNGSEFQINTWVYSWQSGPHLTSLKNGIIVVAWNSFGQDVSGTWGVYGQLLNSNGSKRGDEFRVNTSTEWNQAGISVASFSDDRFIITWWSSHEGDGNGIYGQLFNADGSKDGLEFHVNTYTVQHQSEASVAILSNNHFIVTWASYEQDGSDYGVYGQRFNSDNSKNGSEFQVNTYTMNSQQTPSVASLSDSRFVVTWTSLGQDGNETGIYGQLFNCNSPVSMPSSSSSLTQKSSLQMSDTVFSSNNKISSSSSENRSRSSEILSRSDSTLSSESVVSGESKAVSSSKSVSNGAIPESGFSEDDHSPGITTNSLLTILGSLGGAIGVVTSIIGVWFKYKEYKNASKMYQQNPFAAEIRKGGNIDVSNFGSNEGQRYLKLIDDMANKLEEQGIDIEGMDQEDLRTLTLQSVAVIKEEVEPKEVCCWRKIIPVEELEKRQDAIIAGAVNTFTETRHRDGIAMQAVSSKLETKTEEKGSAVSGRINLDELSKFKKIGQGAFGIVYKAKYHGSNVAVKQLPMHMIEMDPKALDDFRREAELMEKLRHPHVVQFFGYYQDATHYSIVMEFVSGGTLDKALYDKQKPFPWYPTRWYMAHDIASAISFLHNNTVIRIIHRDLKSQNVLVYYQGDRMRAKVADIGIAKVMKEEDAGDTMTKGMGTPLWMAPEVVEAQGRGEKITYDEKVDVYSYGIILSELVNRALPFSEIKNRFDVIPSVLRGERPAVDKESAPINFVSLMEQCWAHRASERPMMKKVVKTLDQMKEEMRSFNTPASQPM